jgi:hypothetical protein
MRQEEPPFLPVTKSLQIPPQVRRESFILLLPIMIKGIECRLALTFWAVMIEAKSKGPELAYETGNRWD